MEKETDNIKNSCDNSKITFLEEKKLQEQAQIQYLKDLDGFVENPIKAKFLAFQKTKRKLKNDTKDLI